MKYPTPDEEARDVPIAKQVVKACEHVHAVIFRREVWAIYLTGHRGQEKQFGVRLYNISITKYDCHNGHVCPV